MNFMKKVYFLLPLVAILVFSCEKADDQVDQKQKQLQEISLKANMISQVHDSLLHLLLKEDTLNPSLVSSEQQTESNFNLENSFDIIEKVVGVRPYVVTNSQIAMMRVGLENVLPQVNLDNDELNLGAYGRSAITVEYLSKVDLLLKDSTMGIVQIQEGIKVLQQSIQNDSKASLNDIEDFMNGTEILKGSLDIWNTSNKVNQTNGMMYASGLKSWSFWKKLGFVAAADAVGGVVGWFLGGFIIIQGQTVYVPAGPSGVMVSAALLSYMAAKMVGW